MEWIDNVLRDVAELPDRNSPEDWPEAMLVTGAELRQIIVTHAPAEPVNARLLEALRANHQWHIDHDEDDGYPDIAQAEIDAKRYRALRRGQAWSVIDGIGDDLRGEALDAAIDAREALNDQPPAKGD